MNNLDTLTRELTAFNTFAEMVDSAPQYRPTIMPRDMRHVDLADAYDAYQAARGDERRAYRGMGAAVYQGLTAPGRNKLEYTLAGVPAGSGLYSEWLRVIHAINRMQPGVIGTPLDSYEVADAWPRGQYALGAFVEEYPAFRVVLHYTAWGHARNFAIIEALTDGAAKLLRTAVEGL